ncbi:Monosaccharide-transporting ATPase [Solidesulfovibrio carbinoliphilus subsp. oakridgensis]|uniref:Monosaccharide-transporting ATPase n=1 Tax=Solidesulfovibrio carbinoliphilus subsp. oakridgensis TaxID=694327 RepID=G7Q5C5_9BACT|nr:ABC transporter ATP-binding protein [Solidesulfovibrio carbinoliphilus]EHJ48926.1 Monosaccharide-transporting ATPase [Solidesulfovibrio carbinoliphilus subsp. oakridgensis]
MTADTPLLDVAAATVRFGGIHALTEADFSIRPGTVTSLIGPNGAGKTTMLNAITGMVALTSGHIRLAGQDIGTLPPHQRAAAGVVRTFQNLEVFTSMTVLENVMAGRHALTRYSTAASLLRTPGFRRAERVCREEALARLDFVGLADERDTPAGELPYGRQRLLEMARALAAEPKLLLLDEPAAGLNSKETARLGDLIAAVRDRLHVTVGLVEHDMDLVMNVSDHITVLHFGHPLASGTPEEVQANDEVVKAYLGEDE